MAHILVVDDEKSLVRLVQLNLERAGHTVSVAHDGQEGLDAARLKHPDLILMDITMPKMDGFEVLTRLKADKATAAIPVVLITARAKDAEEAHGYNSGAELYLHKPLHPQELLQMVNRVLADHKSET